MAELINEIFSITPLNWSGILSTLIAGAIVGFERQYMGKPVGMRTSMLICTGTYTFVVVSNSVSGTMTDPSRIIGQIVTGIGFLGAGVILTKDGIVVGVTSASAIWVLSAIGILIGSGFYYTGIKIAILTVIILIGIDVIEYFFGSMAKGVYKKRPRIFKKFSGD
ncbi:MAG: MgtC/SapB family protein [Spirochaetia bacterium]|nr:MgtC/SapB family protein [Spirochaetia bacterium]